MYADHFRCVSSSGKNRLDRTSRHARPAIDALVRMDIEHIRRRVLLFVLPRVNTVYRTDVHARGILRTDAGLADDIRHFTDNNSVPPAAFVHPGPPATGAIEEEQKAEPDVRSDGISRHPTTRRVRVGGQLRPRRAHASAHARFASRARDDSTEWTRRGADVEHFALIRCPDMTRSNSGTLIIRFTICCT